jgi:hypothetical protein
MSGNPTLIEAFGFGDIPFARAYAFLTTPRTDEGEKISAVGIGSKLQRELERIVGLPSSFEIDLTKISGFQHDSKERILRAAQDSRTDRISSNTVRSDFFNALFVYAITAWMPMQYNNNAYAASQASDIAAKHLDDILDNLYPNHWYIKPYEVVSEWSNSKGPVYVATN